MSNIKGKEWRVMEHNDGYFVTTDAMYKNDVEACKLLLAEAEAGNPEAIAAVLQCQDSDLLLSTIMNGGFL